MKFSRQTISVAIIVLLTLMVVGFNLSFYYLYNEAKHSLDQALGDRLLAVGRTIAPQIETEVANDLRLGELSLSTVVRLNRYFEQIREAEDLSGIHLLDDQDHDLLSWSDSLSEVELFLSLHEEALAAARLGEPTPSAIYQVGDRYFKSALCPVGSDSVVALLVVESGFEFFESFRSFQRNLVPINIATALFLILMGGVVFILNRKLVQAEKMVVSQAALAQMGQMAAIIAHEVRNPLAIIRATAERIKKKYGAGIDDELFSFIQEESDRLAEISGRYLLFAAPAADKQFVESCGSIIESVVDGLRRDFQAAEVDLQITIDDAVREQLLDSGRLRHVLMNLLRNALEACKIEGRVVLEAALQGADRARIVVSDDGPGIDKRRQRQIFDPFFTTKTRGSGLGLFVVRRLVDEMKGTILLESQVGSGTRFVIVIPVGNDG